MQTKTLTSERTFEFTCPKCNTDVTLELERFLHNITGMKKIDLKNGGLEVVRTAFFIGREIMQVRTVEVSNENTARKIVEESMRKLKEIIDPEIQKQKIEEIEERFEENYKHIIEENKQLKRDLKDKDQQYLQNQEQILEVLNKITYQPLISGKMQEKQIAIRLATISKDNFNTMKSNKQGEDILATVVEDKKEIARVIIESKKVKSWSNDFIEQTKKYMQREGANFGIVATTVLPSDALNPKMYKITDDGIWIVKLEYLEICYRALRDFLLKLRHMEDTSSKKITDFEKLTRQFKLRIESKEYQEKFTIVKTCIDSLRDIASNILKNANDDHNKLQEIAKDILLSIETIEGENRNILKEFFN